MRRLPAAAALIELKPDYAAAYNNLANALWSHGRLEEAAECCRKALSLRPDFAEAHNNLGNALHDQGKSEQAIACYRRALELKPEYAEAHGNLGGVLAAIGDFQGAESSVRRRPCAEILVSPSLMANWQNFSAAGFRTTILTRSVVCWMTKLFRTPNGSCCTSAWPKFSTRRASFEKLPKILFTRTHCNPPNGEGEAKSMIRKTTNRASTE